MAQEIRSFAVTIPAGTTVADGFTSDLSFPDRQVVEIDIRVPPGPRGEVGFALGAAGVPVIPRQSGAWIITDDDKIIWPLDGFWDSGSWTFFGYNTGQYDHTVYVTFLVNSLQAATSSSGTTPIDTGTLTSTEPTTPTTPTAPAPTAPTAPTTTAPAAPTETQPLYWPPTLPPFPGEAAPVVDPLYDPLVVADSGSGTVWLISGEAVLPFVDQTSINGVQEAGVLGADVDTEQLLDFGGVAAEIAQLVNAAGSTT